MMTPQTLARPLADRVASLQPLSFALGEEPDIPANVIQAASDALDRGETHYADRPGIPELRALLAGKLNGRYGLTYAPNDITITCGATEARFCCLLVLVKPETLVIAPRDAGNIAPSVALIGATLVEDAPDAPPGSVLYLTPGANAETWLDRAEAGGWWVVWDITGVPAPAYHPAHREALKPRLVTVDDVEDRMPGWRIGWMIGSERHNELRATMQALTICATNVCQWGVLEFLKGEGA